MALSRDDEKTRSGNARLENAKRNSRRKNALKNTVSDVIDGNMGMTNGGTTKYGRPEMYYGLVAWSLTSMVRFVDGISTKPSVYWRSETQKYGGLTDGLVD